MRGLSVVTSVSVTQPMTVVGMPANDAEIVLGRAGGGTRAVPFGEFMVGPKRTVRQPGELITAVSFPVPQAAGYEKYRTFIDNAQWTDIVMKK